MESFSASVVPFISLGEPITSLGGPIVSLGEPMATLGSRITWQDGAPDAPEALPEPAPEAVPTPEAIRQNAARAVPAQVLAWRQAFYAFRKARARVEAGRPADALPFLNGPHGDYVRARFAELGRTDPRFADVLGPTDRPAPETTPTAPRAEPVREAPTPTNQAEGAFEPTPIAYVGSALADAMGMRTLPNTFILEAGAQPEDFNVGTFIKIAADSVERLRHMDVIRLLSDAPPDHLNAVAAFLRINRPDLADEVRDALADVLADRATPAPDASPDQSTPDATPDAVPEVAPVVSGSAIVKRAAFADAVKAARRFAPARCPKPILSCVRVRTEGDDLIVEATDLESAIRIRITQVQIETPLDVCLRACKLSDALDDRSDTVVLRVDGTEATIFAGSGSVKLFTHAPGEFPLIGRADADFARWYDVPALDFTRAMDRALVFTSKEGSRYAFNGVLLSVKDSALNLVATDGRRLLQDSSKLAFHGEAPDGSQLILPALVYKRVRQILGKHPAGTIRLDVTEADGETALRITLGDDATVYATALDGQFPPYEEVIPKEPESCWTFDAAEFLEVVRRGSASVCEDCKGVRMEFDADKGRVTITSRNPAAGESMATLYADSHGGAAMTIGFNPEYLADYLKLAKADGLASISLELTAPNRPGLMKFQDKKTGSVVTYVLMPVNLQ